MARNFVGVQDFRFAAICHLVGLLLLVVHCLPSGVASSETNKAIAPDARLLDINDNGQMQEAKTERTRLTREAVLPLGHRYIGLGKRLEADTDVDGIASRGDTNKRRYALKQGNAMRFTGLGKRGGGGGGGGHSGLRFIGLGKRNPAAMRFIGLGKRVITGGYGDGEGQLDLDSNDYENFLEIPDIISFEDLMNLMDEY